MAFDGEPDDWRPKRPRCRMCAGAGTVPLWGFGCGRDVIRQTGSMPCFFCAGTGFDDENSYGFGDLGDD